MKLFWIILFILFSIACKTNHKRSSEIHGASQNEFSLPEGRQIFGLYDDEVLVVLFWQSNKGRLTDWDDKISLYIKSKANLSYHKALFNDSFLEYETLNEDVSFLKKTKNLEIPKDADPQQQYRAGGFIYIDAKELNDFFAIEKTHENKLIANGTDKHFARTYVKNVKRNIRLDLMEDDGVIDDSLGNATLTKEAIEVLRALPNKTGYYTLEAKEGVIYSLALRIYKRTDFPDAQEKSKQ